jgi:hypothetical protein
MKIGRGRGKRGLLSSIDAIRSIAVTRTMLCIVLTSGCLDPMEPAPTSSVVTITPTTRSVRGQESETGSRFGIEFRVRNTGSRTIFLDQFYAHTEKLIDQKWKVVMETTPPVFASARTIPTGQSVTAQYLVQYVGGVSPESPYLEHVRGLYRVRLRLSYRSNGSELVPPEESYSEPFVVNN